MRRVLTYVAIAALSRCSAAPQHDVASEPAPTPSYSVEAACDSITFTTSGWPAGTTISVGTDGQPSYGAAINTTQTFWVPSTAPDATGAYGWYLVVSVPGSDPVQYEGEHTGCEPYARCS